MTIDFQGLLNVVKAAENEPNLVMNHWVEDTSCGTTHCMIGAYCSQTPGDRLYLDSEGIPKLGMTPPYCHYYEEEAIAERFGITINEATFLFIASPLRKPRCLTASLLTKEQALAHLRKFIYYKLRKQELIIETGRNKQRIDLGRSIPGNSAALLAQTA